MSRRTPLKLALITALVGATVTVPASPALAADLKARYPRMRLFLSTTTLAGQQVARQSLQNVDAVFYFPFDWNFIVRRTLNIVKPRVFVMMETEIWPNLLRMCRARGVKTVVINGRISSRSYPRYKMMRPFFRRVLADVDRFCMQSEEAARRLRQKGVEVWLGNPATEVGEAGIAFKDGRFVPSRTRCTPALSKQSSERDLATAFPHGVS